MSVHRGAIDHLVAIAKAREFLASGRARQERERWHLSQSEVARALGVEVSSVSRWESGEQHPRAEHALVYAEVLRRLADTS